MVRTIIIIIIIIIFSPIEITIKVMGNYKIITGIAKALIIVIIRGKFRKKIKRQIRKKTVIMIVKIFVMKTMTIKMGILITHKM